MNSVSKQRLDAKAREVKTLDTATQDLLKSVKKKNNRALLAAIIAFSLLFLVGVITLVFVLKGINRQNQLAQQNTNHIDCIVKLLATPLPSNKEHKVIEYLGATCKVRFTD